MVVLRIRRLQIRMDGLIPVARIWRRRLFGTVDVTAVILARGGRGVDGRGSVPSGCGLVNAELAECACVSAGIVRNERPHTDLNHGGVRSWSYGRVGRARV